MEISGDDEVITHEKLWFLQLTDHILSCTKAIKDVSCPFALRKSV